MITLDKIYHAAFVLKEVARRTDLIHAPNLVKDTELYLKTENLQVTGSFKLRGAYYKISQLTDEQKKAGIIACSAGNHAQGVALAATRQGARSVVYMPDSAPISKVEATKRLGAEVVLVDGIMTTLPSSALVTRGSTVVASIAMVLMPACSTPTAAMVVLSVATARAQFYRKNSNNILNSFFVYFF